jgi:drug/metabolite transporter (DMT)-like permease
MAIGRGEAETLIAAIFFAVQILTLEAPRFAANRGRPVTLVMCAGIAVLFSPLALLAAGGRAGALVDAGRSWTVLAMVAVLAVFCTVGAFVLMNSWQRRVSATEAGLIYTSEPVFAAAYALFLPGLLSRFAGVAYPDESLTVPLVTGGGLIVVANIWMQWRRSPHRPGIAPAP